MLVEIHLQNVPAEKRLRATIKNLESRLDNFNSTGLILNTINNVSDPLQCNRQKHTSLAFWEAGLVNSKYSSPKGCPQIGWPKD